MAEVLAAPVADEAAAVEVDLFGEPMPPAAPRGRPAGAVNRTSADLREFLAARGADPRLHLARRLAISAADLAKELKCGALEAAALQDRAAAALLPYVQSKAPQEHHVTGEHLTLVLSDGGPADREAGLVGRAVTLGPVLNLGATDDDESEQ